MELLCPACQRKLTILDEYANQVMKCPMCAATFTAPALQSAPSPPPPAPASNYPTPAPAPTPPPPPTPPPAPTGPTDYTKKMTVWISPRVLVYVAPICLFLAFFLSLFFPWVAGQVPGNNVAVSQSAWQGAFGLFSQDTSYEKDDPFPKDKGPGFSPFLFFYDLGLFPVLLVAAAVLVMQFVPFKLPPVVAQLLPWRWAFLGALALVMFLLLVLESTFGFGIENRISALAASTQKDNSKIDNAKIAAQRTAELATIQRTTYYNATWWLLLLATVGAFTMFWFERRPLAPLPRVDIQV